VDALLAFNKHGRPGPDRALLAAVGAMLIDEAFRHLRAISGKEITVTIKGPVKTDE
jgi:hypothetical protein